MDDGTKPTCAVSAITDLDFLPTLDEAPVTQHVKSHLLVLSLIVGGVFLARFIGFGLSQVSQHQSWVELVLGLGAVVAAVVGTLYWTGSHYIDWWEVILG
jgi:hypothetical protein